MGICSAVHRIVDLDVNHLVDVSLVVMFHLQYSYDFKIKMMVLCLYKLVPLLYRVEGLDRVKYDKIIEATGSCIVDDADIRIITALYWNQTAKIKIENHTADSVNIKREFYYCLTYI